MTKVFLEDSLVVGATSGDSSLQKNLLSTGLISGGTLTINADNTKFDISAGNGLVIDNYTDANNPVKNAVSWDTQTAITVDNIATQPFTIIAYDKDGVLQQLGFIPNIEQTRDYIVLGLLDHSNLTNILTISHFPTYIPDSHLALYDSMKAIGLINIGNGNQFFANGTNLQINKTAGVLHSLGANAYNDPKNPNRTTQPALIGANFKYVYRDGAGGFTTTASTNLITPTLYDDGDGTLGVVLNNQWSIQRVFIVPDNSVFIQYGQNTYISLAEAENNITTEDFEVDPILNNIYFCGWIIVRGGATDLSDDGDNRFLTSGKLGDLNSSGTSSVSPIVDHNMLLNLQGGTTDEYYHLTQAQHTIATQPASATVSGYMTTTAQTFSGAKTFNDGLNIATGQTYKINNVDINTGGTLSNVAYLNQPNTFSANTNSFRGTARGDIDLIFGKPFSTGQFGKHSISGYNWGRNRLHLITHYNGLASTISSGYTSHLVHGAESESVGTVGNEDTISWKPDHASGDVYAIRMGEDGFKIRYRDNAGSSANFNDSQFTDLFSLTTSSLTIVDKFKFDVANSSDGNGMVQLTNNYTISGLGNAYPNRSIKISVVDPSNVTHYAEYLGNTRAVGVQPFINLVANAGGLTVATNTIGTFTASSTTAMMMITIF